MKFPIKIVAINKEDKKKARAIVEILRLEWKKEQKKILFDNRKYKALWKM